MMRRRAMLVLGLLAVGGVTALLLSSSNRSSPHQHSSADPARSSGPPSDTEQPASEPLLEGDHSHTPSQRPNPASASSEPAQVLVLLPKQDSQNGIHSVVAREVAASSDAARAENIDGKATLSLPPGTYGLSWYVRDLGIHRETLSLQAGERATLDRRTVNVARLEFPEKRGRLRISVRDYAGRPLVGIRVEARDLESRPRRTRTDAAGKCSLLVRGGTVSISCGGFLTDVRVRNGEELEVYIPGAQASLFGELVTLPATAKLRIRRAGESEWFWTQFTETGGGRRFPFVREGAYEVGQLLDGEVQVLGEVQVRGGQRVVYKSETGLIRFRPNAGGKKLPTFFRFVLTGESPGTSHRDGYSFAWATQDEAATILLRGLQPGSYRILSLEGEFPFDRRVELRPGTAETVDISFGSNAPER